MMQVFLALVLLISADLTTFIGQVSDGSAEVRGVWSEGALAAQVVQQPKVPNKSGVVAEFAVDIPTVGLVAHSYLEGVHFKELGLGDSVWVIYGGGRAVEYKVVTIEKYVEQGSGSFLGTEGVFTGSDLFFKYYMVGGLTLQTCGENLTERVFIHGE